MSRETAWIWARTWRNIDDDAVPPLPEDMSVLAWTVLVFGGTECQASQHLLLSLPASPSHLGTLTVEMRM